MNESEAGRVLLMAISLDPKMPQPDDAGFIRSMWARALPDVPAEAAQRAVIAYYRSDHYAQTRETISPADIVQSWNARRRPSDAERSGESAASRRSLPAPPADPRRIMAGVSLARASLLVAKGIDPDVAEGEAEAARTLRTKRCPHCGAQPGARCTTARGKPLTQSPVHDSRMRAVMGQAVDVEPRSASTARREIAEMDHSLQIDETDADRSERPG